MRKIMRILIVAGAAAAVCACGHTTSERAATGAVAGAVVAGPIGAAVGAGAGTVVSKAAHDK